MQTTPAPVKIGILDADLGGLPLAAAISSRWPQLPVCYLADTAHRPIGERSPRLVRRQIGLCLDGLRQQGADLILLASQTMAALREGSPVAEPGVVDPLPLAAAAAAEASPSGRIGVIASRATVDSGAYPRLIEAIRPEARVHAAAAPLLGPLLDAGRENSPEGRLIVKKYLHRLKVRQVDTLILGASACSRIAPLIQRKIGPRVRLVDPLSLALERLAHRLGPWPPSSELAVSLRLLVTDAGPAVTETIQRVLRRRVDPVQIRL